MAARPLGQKTRLTFRVETTWPDTSRPEKAEEFDSYYARAYTDVRDPGYAYDKMLVNTQKELFDKRSTTQYGGVSESLHFDKREDAIAVAQFLQKWGRMGLGWDTDSQEIHQKQKRGPLKVRVIAEYELSNRELVYFEEAAPADDYETELAALKKKHGKE